MDSRWKSRGALALENAHTVQETWLEVPHDDSLNIKTDQITLMCWVKITDAGVFNDSGFEGVFIWKNGPFQENRRFWTSYALLMFRLKSEIGSFAFDSNMTEGRGAAVDPDYPPVAAVNTWFHIGATADGAEIKVYTNGKEKAAKPQRGKFQDSDLPLTIGFDLRNPKQALARNHLGFLRGVIDEVVILDHALTAAQIKEAMALGEKGDTLVRYQPVFAVEAQGKLATKWGEIKATR